MVCAIVHIKHMYLKIIILVSMVETHLSTEFVNKEHNHDSSKKINLHDCGISKRTGEIGSRIVGGKKTDISKFPWTVSFQKKTTERSQWKHFCGGSVINNRWLLSASHCFQGVKHSIKRVRAVLGSTEWNDPDADSYQVDKLVMHEKYNSYNYKNDIALIKTKTPIKFKSDSNHFYINSICLDSPSHPMPENASIYGWGLLGEESKISEELMTTTLGKANMTMCNLAYEQYIGKLSKQMICYSSPGKDACQGDSGGPLSHLVKGKEHQSGIVSFGLGCARADAPGIYTIVGMYLDWVKNTIKNK